MGAAKVVLLAVFAVVAMVCVACVSGCGTGTALDGVGTTVQTPTQGQDTPGDGARVEEGDNTAAELYGSDQEAPPEEGGEEPSRMIGADPRMAVVYECFYALRKGWLNPPNTGGPFGGKLISGCVVSDWNYLASDPNAFQAVKNLNGSNISRWGTLVGTPSMPLSRYGFIGGYGRGLQCVSFAQLIIYRARKGYFQRWGWYSINQASYPSARYAQPGDLVFKKTGLQHVAVVVKRLSGGLDLVDSNSVGWGTYPVRSGYKDSEIIGRHPISWAQIDTYGWKTFSGKGRWY